MIVVRLDELAAGGDAVGRDEGGRVTFVPRGAPGDLASLALTKQTKTFARGDLVEIIEPSPSRVTPPCASFVAGCGGCQWQHIARGAQHAAKQTIVEKALRKVGVEVVLEPSDAACWA
ncbi:MAG: TRAM domain-containing protein, partial [Proteobacteria bacterium]|nr:TRAM domain-containing protein [Pseudomonadota bacterium]